MHGFEKMVRDRALQSLNYGIAQCGGFVTVGDLQQFACGWQPAEPEQVASLARRFGIRVRAPCRYRCSSARRPPRPPRSAVLLHRHSVDSYGHSVRSGAFDRSIAKRGLTGPSGVKLLAGHEGFPVGAIKSLRKLLVRIFALKPN